MRYFLTIMFVTTFIYASLLDFKYLKDAKEAYNSKKYEEAERLYEKVDNDEARFNMADSLYRQQKYKEAIGLYKSITDPKLKAKTLHNIGNSYAQMGEIEKGINAYESALKIKDDEDTKFNLELLKRKKKEKEQQKKKNSQDKEQQKKRGGEEGNSEQKKEKKKQDKKDDRDGEKKKKKKDENKKAQKNIEQNQTQQPPISNMEERKWQKMLNKKGVTTLMIPLKKGENRNNEENPW